MIFITGRNKRAIEDHFDKAYELESELEAAGKVKLLKPFATSFPSTSTASTCARPNPGPGPRRAAGQAVGGRRALRRPAG
jgi:UTP-glucose-1-phosphate uridylyltransferase